MRNVIREVKILDLQQFGTHVLNFCHSSDFIVPVYSHQHIFIIIALILGPILQKHCSVPVFDIIGTSTAFSDNNSKHLSITAIVYYYTISKA